MSIDVRTRTDGDIRAIDPGAFFSDELPKLLATTGPLAARAARRLGPISVRIEGASYTLRPVSGTLEITNDEPADAAAVIEMASKTFSEWIQEVRSMLALLVSKDAELRSGDANTALGWDVVFRAMVDGRLAYEPGSVTLTNSDGSPLDVNRSFGPDADDAELEWFLEQAGFLMLRGWIDPDIAAAISQDIDRGVAAACRDDPHRWWARLENGAEICVRIKRFRDISDVGRRIAGSSTFRRICNLTGDSFAFPTSSIEALVKPAGVVAGASEMRWHKDCWQGRHPFLCNGLSVGILVAPSNEQTGGFRVMAGSHRANFPAIDRAIDTADLPIRPLYGGPGDLTVHLSCTMHETVPPAQGERRLMYSIFPLVDRGSGERVNDRYEIKHADWASAVSSAWDVLA